MLGTPTAFLWAGNNRGRRLPDINGEDPFGSVWAIVGTTHGSARIEASGGHKSLIRLTIPEPSDNLEIWINGQLLEKSDDSPVVPS